MPLCTFSWGTTKGLLALESLVSPWQPFSLSYFLSHSTWVEEVPHCCLRKCLHIVLLGFWQECIYSPLSGMLLLGSCPDCLCLLNCHVTLSLVWSGTFSTHLLLLPCSWHHLMMPGCVQLEIQILSCYAESMLRART